jgi:hypothetical protein
MTLRMDNDRRPRKISSTQMKNSGSLADTSCCILLMRRTQGIGRDARDTSDKEPNYEIRCCQSIAQEAQWSV